MVDVISRRRGGAWVATAAVALGLIGALGSFASDGEALAKRPALGSEGEPTGATGGAALIDQERVQAAVSKGHLFLRRTQDVSGGWVQDVGYKQGNRYVVTDSGHPHVGVTALALMSFLAGGHLPGRGEYGSVVEKGTDFILSSVDPSNGFINGHGTRMYSHAFATLFLAQIYGMTHRADVRKKLQLAVDLTVDCQTDAGGWRYAPYSPRQDMSVTVCQIMALRSARNVGIRVPKSSIDRALDYVDGSAEKGADGRTYGGFRYKIEDGDSRTTFPLTAAGIATLNYAGVYQSALINSGIAYLKALLPTFNAQQRGHYFYWYGHYYASQVFFLSTQRDDSLWKWYWARVCPDLLGFQESEGSWPNPVGPGRPFATAVATIILQIPNNYLPIFNR